MNTQEFLTAVLRNPINAAIAYELFRLALPDAWIVSGCLVQTVLNIQTARAVDYGINDYDVFYFDPDTSWQAEDAVIRQLESRLVRFGVRIEIRNQARVHLWYPEKHGLPYPALSSSAEGIDRFLTRNPRLESAARRQVTMSMHHVALTISRTWSSAPTRVRIFRRQTTRQRQGAGKGFGRNSR